MYSYEDAKKLEIEEVWQLYSKHVNPKQVELIASFPFGRQLVKEAHGCWITLKNGEKVLDLTGGIGVLNHGHNHPRILEVRKKFAEQKQMEVHKNFFSPFLAALGANVAELLPSELPYSYFPNSGAEAVEGAVKLAYKFHEGKRQYVLHSNISFHGKLLGAAGLTGSPEVHFKFPTIPNAETFVYNDIHSVNSLVKKFRAKDSMESDVYAIIVEPLNASTMQMCSPEFLLELRRICVKENIVLIFDEVYTGWGKTGTLFNFFRVEGLVPDIVTYAKSFGGGKASISGYSYSAKLASSYQTLKDATLHSTTYYGFGEETVTALEALNIIRDEGLVENSHKIGIQVERALNEVLVNCEYLSEVRGSGALWGLIFKSQAAERMVELIKPLGRFSELISELITDDPRFSQKLVVGSIVNSLYREHRILTYFGVNVENPLIISFPLIAKESEILHATKAISATLSKPLSFHILNFIKSKLSGPRQGGWDE